MEFGCFEGGREVGLKNCFFLKIICGRPHSNTTDEVNEKSDTDKWSIW